MYPNDNQQPVPVDYLNQIAPHQTHKFDLFNKKPVMFEAIGIGILLIFAIFAVIGNLSSSGTKTNEKLAARLNATSSVVDGAKTKMKSSQLRAINAGLNTLLLNEITDITPILAKDGITITKIDKTITSAESTDAMLARLEDARLNIAYDRVYAIEMTAQLDKIIVLMNQIYKSTNSASLKAFLSNSLKNLEPIRKQFSEFDSSKL